MTVDMDAKQLNELAGDYLKELEAQYQVFDARHAEVYQDLKARLGSGPVQGDAKDKEQLRETIREMDSFTIQALGQYSRRSLIEELDDGTDPLAPLREVIDQMVMIEEGEMPEDGEEDPDEVYWALSDMCGMSGQQYKGQLIDGGREMKEALEEYEKSGKLSSWGGGELLANLASSLSINLTKLADRRNG